MIGFAYIKREAPQDNEPNDILKWVVAKTKCASPLTGWPMPLVQKACENQVKALQGADAQHFYPLTIFDFLPTIWQLIVPLIFALGLERGILLLAAPAMGEVQPKPAGREPQAGCCVVPCVVARHAPISIRAAMGPEGLTRLRCITDDAGVHADAPRGDSHTWGR